MLGTLGSTAISLDLASPRVRWMKTYQILVEGKILIIVLYVDDLILMGDEKLIHSCKEDLAKEFEMKDMGLLHYFLGL